MLRKATKEDKKVKEERLKTDRSSKSGNNPWKKVNIQKEIENLEERLKEIDRQINEFGDNYEKLNSIYSEKLDLEQRLEALMEEYFGQIN